jgi:hypothetical protein
VRGHGGYRRGRNWPRALTVGAPVLLLPWLGNAAQAQEWTLDTTLSQQFLYSDNLLLGRENEIETFGSVTSPILRLERASPTTSIWIDGKFDFNEYLNHSEFNSQDQRLRLGVTDQVTERSTLKLGGSFVRDTTLKSDQEQSDRFVDKKIGITFWDVRPSWTYLLSPVDQMTLGGSYSSAAYDSDEKTDYQYFGGTLDYGHRLSEIGQLTANMSYFRFVPDETGDRTTDTVSALLGYAYTPSDRLSISGAAGLGYSMENGSGGSDDDDNDNDSDGDGGLGFRLKFNAQYKLDDRTSGRMALSHDSEPSSDGDQTTRNRLSLGVNHKLTPLTSIGLNIDYTDTFDYLGSESGERTDSAESRYAAVRPSISWALTDDLSLVAEYRYRYKLYDESNETATSNSVFLTLRYELPTWAWDGY